MKKAGTIDQDITRPEVPEPPKRRESFTESFFHSMSYRHDYEIGSALGTKK
jgi:hypothetical protein